jgi:hypothetical protein
MQRVFSRQLGHVAEPLNMLLHISDSIRWSGIIPFRSCAIQFGGDLLGFFVAQSIEKVLRRKKGARRNGKRPRWGRGHDAA